MGLWIAVYTLKGILGLKKVYKKLLPNYKLNFKILFFCIYFVQSTGQVSWNKQQQNRNKTWEGSLKTKYHENFKTVSILKNMTAKNICLFTGKNVLNELHFTLPCHKMHMTLLNNWNYFRK